MDRAHSPIFPSIELPYGLISITDAKCDEECHDVNLFMQL